MAHPHRKEASDAHNAKLRHMTTEYGLASGPANNITTPGERLKGESGETHVGFGADSENASAARGDRAARRAVAANPVATYAKGGKVKHRDDGGATDQSPPSQDSAITASGATIRSGARPNLNASYNPKTGKVSGFAKGGKAGDKVASRSEEKFLKEEMPAEGKSTGGVIARARGGRAKHGKGATHVNVIVAPQGSASPAGAGPSPQLAALAGAHPPMGGPPPGGPPMPPPGIGGPPPGGPPPMIPRKRGGKVMGGHPDAAQDKELIEKTLKEEGLVRKARGGGIHMTAGAITGEGRLEKMGIKIPSHRGSMKPKEI
jgi:hypothetical protein